MKIVCSYCRKDLGTKPPLDDPTVTHSMCRECFKAFAAQWSGLEMSEYLDRFDSPVIVFDGDVRVVGLNRAACDVLGKTAVASLGLLGGEVLECQFSRMPEGCGRTVHCKACTIRKSIQATLDTGRPEVRVPAYYDKGEQHMDLLISTRMDGDVVRVEIHEVKSSETVEQ